MKSLSPVVIFAYKRVEKFDQLISSLLKNKESNKTVIYIFLDGFKNISEKKKNLKIKDQILKIKGFKKIFFYHRKKNIGLAKNIISGINLVFRKNSKAIFLEDDLIVSSNFLKFMNIALSKYYKNKKVWHINGWSYDFNDNKSDVFFSNHMNCWGWATWKNRWVNFEKNPRKFIKKFDTDMIQKFNLNNVIDNWSQLIRNYQKKISTWAIFWYATIFINKGLCLSFNPSLIKYNGFDFDSTHSLPNSPMNVIYKNSLSKKKYITFPDDVTEDIKYEVNLFNFIKRKKNFLFYLKIFIKKIIN
jgi:hypothetical protein